MKITITKHEHIIGIKAKHCAGPGWSNAPLYIHILDYVTNEHRSVCIQPKDQTRDMQLLFNIVATANSAMLNAIDKITIHKG